MCKVGYGEDLNMGKIHIPEARRLRFRSMYLNAYAYFQYKDKSNITIGLELYANLILTETYSRIQKLCLAFYYLTI